PSDLRVVDPAVLLPLARVVVLLAADRLGHGVPPAARQPHRLAPHALPDQSHALLQLFGLPAELREPLAPELAALGAGQRLRRDAARGPRERGPLLALSDVAPHGEQRADGPRRILELEPLLAREDHLRRLLGRVAERAQPPQRLAHRRPVLPHHRRPAHRSLLLL